MLGEFSLPHILIVLAVVFLVFGAKRLPELGRSLGSGMRGFKESISGETPAPSQIEEQSSPTQETSTAA